MRGVVLQAPVSDRDWRESLPETARFVGEARERLAAGGVAAGKELMPTAAEADAPITVSRYLSLSTKASEKIQASSWYCVGLLRSASSHTCLSERHS